MIHDYDGDAGSCVNRIELTVVTDDARDSNADVGNNGDTDENYAENGDDDSNDVNNEYDSHADEGNHGDNHNGSIGTLTVVMTMEVTINMTPVTK